MPGVSAGTTKAETPLGPATPVRAMTTSTSVSPAPEIKALAPLITYDEPRFSARVDSDAARSEEHTSELQSLMRISYAVFCLKKKNKRKKNQLSQAQITHVYGTRQK